MLKTYRELESELVVQKRDSLDDFSALWKSNRDASAGPVPGGSDRPYSQHAWVYACITSIARNVAQVPWVLTDTSSEKTLPEDHPIQKLFQKPNPLMSRYELWYATELYLNLGGNCIWVPVPSVNGRNIVELWPFSKNQARAEITNNIFRGWKIDWRGFKDFFLPDEVLHFRYFSPYHPVYGMAPLEAAKMAIDQDYWANKYNETFFRNFAEPGIILSAPGKLTNEQIIQIRESFEARHQGFNKARKTMLLQGDMKVTELGMTKRDMQFTEQLRMTMQQVMSVFHVPPAEMMNFESVSSRVESAGAQRRLFGEEVIAPELMMLQDNVNGWLASLDIGVEGFFDTSEVSILQDSRSELITQAKELAAMGWPINAVNEKLGLGFEKVPWGDEWFVPAGMVPASLLMDGGNGMAPKESPPPAKPKQLTEGNLEGTPPEFALGRDVRSGVVETGMNVLENATGANVGADPAVLGSIPEDDSVQNGDIPPIVPPKPDVDVRIFLSDEDIRTGKKVQRWLFELRNQALREADGLGEVRWDEEEVRLSKMIPIAADVVNGIRGSIEGKSKDDIKRLFGFLKNQSPRIAHWALLKREENPSADPDVRVIEYEDIDRDMVWESVIAFTGPIERKYASALFRYFTDLEKEYLEEFRKQSASFPDAEVREPGLDWDAKDALLQKVSSPHIGAGIVEAGKCSRLSPRAATAKVTHVPMSKEVRARAFAGEERLSQIIKGTRTVDNAPVDVIVGRNAIEVKTFVSQQHSKVTIHPESLKRKLAFVKKNRMTGHTVVVDARGAELVYYLRKGFGSFRLESMEKVTAEQLTVRIGLK